MTPVRVLVVALLLVPLGLAACGDDAPVPVTRSDATPPVTRGEAPGPISRAEGEPCVEAYEEHERLMTADEQAYHDALEAMLRACTPRALRFAQDLDEPTNPSADYQEYREANPAPTYDEWLKEYCDYRDRYRETGLCAGVPQ